MKPERSWLQRSKWWRSRRDSRQIWWALLSARPRIWVRSIRWWVYTHRSSFDSGRVGCHFRVDSCFGGFARERRSNIPWGWTSRGWDAPSWLMAGQQTIKLGWKILGMIPRILQCLQISEIGIFEDAESFDGHIKCFLNTDIQITAGEMLNNCYSRHNLMCCVTSLLVNMHK